jgi:hypothetical protein
MNKPDSNYISKLLSETNEGAKSPKQKPDTTAHKPLKLEEQTDFKYYLNGKLHFQTTLQLLLASLIIMAVSGSWGKIFTFVIGGLLLLASFIYKMKGLH